MGDTSFNSTEQIVIGFNIYFTDIGEQLQNTIKPTNFTIYDYLGTRKPFKFTFEQLTEEQ